MEEDIKILKGFTRFQTLPYKIPMSKEGFENFKKAIKNILNELERLQKKNERLIERNIKYDETLEKLQKETIWRFKIQNKIEELEKNKNKLDEINETTRLYSPYDTYDFQINILKELLGDE